jgi:hypothetical protein
MHWRFSTKLSFSIQGSLSGMPQSLEVSLHTLFVHLSDVELQLMGVADDIMTHVGICLVY